MCYDSRYLTIEGEPQERDRWKHPYSYTRYCIYKNGWKKNDLVAYSDRFLGSEIKERILGKKGDFSLFPPEKIQLFLSESFGCKVVLTGIEQACNAGNGYPYWLLYYRKV